MGESIGLLGGLGWVEASVLGGGLVWEAVGRVARCGMTGLMDKLRAVLGRRGLDPRDASEALGSPSTTGGVSPGEPTLGSALGMNVEQLGKRGGSEFEPDTERAENPDDGLQ